MNRRNLMLGAGAAVIAAVIPVVAFAKMPAKAWVKFSGKGIANAEIAHITRDGDSYHVQFADGFQARVALQGV